MPTYTDSVLYQAKRQELVNQLRKAGITNEKVLAAINAVPRHYFLDSAFEHFAYENRAFNIASGQTISQPYTVAHQSALLNIAKFDKVLEIGTGSGYQACILAELGAFVHTIERQKVLFEQTSKFAFIKQKYPTIKLYYGDGYLGLPKLAPFDKVIVTAGAPFIPPALVEQLKPGGIMVIPVGEDDKQQMLKIVKNADGTYEHTITGSFTFVPMLEGTGKQQ